MIKRLSALRPSGLHPMPRRLPPPEPLPLAHEWPDNATGAERFDPVWKQLLRKEGKDAVRKRIDALRNRDREEQP